VNSTPTQLTALERRPSSTLANVKGTASQSSAHVALW
jgi:hypothetical protein